MKQTRAFTKNEYEKFKYAFTCHLNITKHYKLKTRQDNYSNFCRNKNQFDCVCIDCLTSEQSFDLYCGLSSIINKYQDYLPQRLQSKLYKRKRELAYNCALILIDTHALDDGLRSEINEKYKIKNEKFEKEYLLQLDLIKEYKEENLNNPFGAKLYCLSTKFFHNKNDKYCPCYSCLTSDQSYHIFLNLRDLLGKYKFWISQEQKTDLINRLKQLHINWGGSIPYLRSIELEKSIRRNKRVIDDRHSHSELRKNQKECA